RIESLRRENQDHLRRYENPGEAPEPADHRTSSTHHATTADGSKWPAATVRAANHRPRAKSWQRRNGCGIGHRDLHRDGPRTLLLLAGWRKVKRQSNQSSLRSMAGALTSAG